MAEHQATVSRRTLLVAAGGASGVLLLAGACTTTDTPTPISPDQAALDTALAGEEALISAFTPGVNGSSVEQKRGAAALRSHQVHADALIDAGATPPAPTPTPTPAITGSSQTARQLAGLQRAQADLLERLALGVSPRVALLLGSIAASDSATAALLGAGR
jgi:hypothetical protein